MLHAAQSPFTSSECGARRCVRERARDVTRATYMHTYTLYALTTRDERTCTYLTGAAAVASDGASEHTGAQTDT
jgi:hypothetical protein